MTGTAKRRAGDLDQPVRRRATHPRPEAAVAAEQRLAAAAAQPLGLRLAVKRCDEGGVVGEQVGRTGTGRRGRPRHGCRRGQHGEPPSTARALP